MHFLFRLLPRALLCSVFAFGGASVAHDIPGKVTILLYVKVERDRVLVLARAPLESMAEIQYPVRGPGFLDLSRADTALRDAASMYLVADVRLFADGQPLDGSLKTVRVSLPSDKSFTEFASALAHVQASPLPAEEQLYWKQAALDVLLEYPNANTDAALAIEAGWQRLAMETHTVLRFIPTDGRERVFDFSGDPGRFQLEPGWWHSFFQFIQLGFWHILDGVDHLLFLFCLLIPARNVRALIPAVTAFTLAHTVTLISSALGLVPTASWFAPLIEALIALSVLYMACENIFGVQIAARWKVVFCFGLIHGFGFSFILADRMQFAGNHLVSSLLAFNVGVELGQVAVLVVATPLLALLLRGVRRIAHGEQIAVILLSAFAAHSAWHWLVERGESLAQFSWQRPTLDAAFLAATLRWLMLLLACAALLWALHELIARFTGKIKNASSEPEGVPNR